MKQVLESPNTNEMMAALFPKHDDNEFQDVSEDFKNIGKEQSNIEVHNIMITDAIQCKTGHTYHLGQNDYSFDALQAYCFGINIKL